MVVSQSAEAFSGVTRLVVSQSAEAFSGVTGLLGSCVYLIYGVLGIPAGIFLVLVIAVIIINVIPDTTNNPGLTLHPSQSIISYNSSHKHNDYITQLDKFIEDYETPPVDSIICNATTTPEPGQSCWYEKEWLGSMCVKNNWGYLTTAPCILVTPNMVVDWVPETYSSKEELPHEMPQSLKNVIINNWHETATIPKLAWVSCEVVSGEGECSLTPWSGFPHYYFPYNNNTNYRSPIIAATVNWRGTEKKIEMKFQLWAKNINPNDTTQTIVIEADQPN
ncbi:hypothetical protein Pmani_030021 [Petrolisthes manimaculis]|uniref:Uncharacterized protein n=1 Tax=Petrolisthes manimaculis TaxID=1843537 RepID=A0AAE1NWV6_9EUCA|nr:hypothetical protein Pmani_030021 [Petrolisthes manimaculis]